MIAGAAVEPLLAVLRPRLAGYAAALGAPGRALRPAPAEEHRHSSLLVFEWADGAAVGGVVVKRHRGPRATLAAEEEYRNLCALDAHFGRHASCRVPRPLECLPEHQAVVMERVTAPRLDRTIRAAARRFAPASQGAPALCRGAGLWLRALGRWERSRPGAADAARAAWERERERIVTDARRAGLPDAVARRVVRALEAAGPGDDGPGPVHNDFAPYNVHADGEAVRLVDLSEMPVGSLEQCAGFFWAALDLAKLHPLLASAELSRCQRAFEEGWGRSVADPWKLWGLARHFSYLRPPAAGEPPAASWWRRWKRAAIARRLARLAA